MSTNLDSEELSKELVNERKLYRERLYNGIFAKHRQTLFVFGAFLKLFKTTTARRKECYEAKCDDEEAE